MSPQPAPKTHTQGQSSGRHCRLSGWSRGRLGVWEEGPCPPNMLSRDSGSVEDNAHPHTPRNICPPSSFKTEKTLSWEQWPSVLEAGCLL